MTYGRSALNKKFLHYRYNISKVDIATDFHEREVKLGCENKKDVLLKMLDSELKGVNVLKHCYIQHQTVLFCSLGSLITGSCLANHYIVLSANQKNLYDKFLFQLNRDDRKLFETSYSLA